VHKAISVLVLFLWIGCFFHCFSEKLGIAGFQAANAEACCGGDAEPDKTACVSCDILFQWTSTAVYRSLLAAPLSDFAGEIGQLDFVKPTLDPDTPPPHAITAEQPCRLLCEELVLTGLPVRGPTAA